MLSDILVLLDAPVDEHEANNVKATILAATSSASVSFNPSSKTNEGKVFLVKFDPKIDHPNAILQEVKKAGWNARIAGG